MLCRGLQTHIRVLVNALSVVRKGLSTILFQARKPMCQNVGCQISA